MNRRFGVPALAGPGRLKAGHQTSFAAKSGSWSQCMRKKRDRALHEPEGRARQSPARRLCIAELRRARSDAPYRFKVPMHAPMRQGAFHEP